MTSRGREKDIKMKKMHKTKTLGFDQFFFLLKTNPNSRKNKNTFSISK